MNEERFAKEMKKIQSVVSLRSREDAQRGVKAQGLVRAPEKRLFQTVS